MAHRVADERGLGGADDHHGHDHDKSPAEEVHLTVPATDDPSVPACTFRAWAIRLLSCALMSFVN
ncbi:hypothetical protein C2845_PM12G24090 [Panicum miliaceum]|uniref:Uncharacterized protein n=1 Tax=Panicum miliaceum TaxID=4540 RepID=A0A3L6QFX1_PANMI|nr:hypothetical protein C2845_PM12G24090 [Panicum miliaceum]